MNYIKTIWQWAEPGYRWTLETVGELVILAGRGCRWLGRLQRRAQQRAQMVGQQGRRQGLRRGRVTCQLHGQRPQALAPALVAPGHARAGRLGLLQPLPHPGARQLQRHTVHAFRKVQFVT